MRVAVVGSRCAGPEVMEMIFRALPVGCSEIVSGGAAGVDTLARRVAGALHIRYTCLRPRYRKYGRSAPLLRNIDIVERADMVLAFWDGRSRGTRQALGCCISRRKPFRIFLINTHDRIVQCS